MKLHYAALALAMAATPTMAASNSFRISSLFASAGEAKEEGLFASRELLFFKHGSDDPEEPMGNPCHATDTCSSTHAEVVAAMIAAESDLTAEPTLICVCPGEITQGSRIEVPEDANFVLGCSLDENGDEAPCLFVGGQDTFFELCRGGDGTKAKVEMYDISIKENGNSVCLQVLRGSFVLLCLHRSHSTLLLDRTMRYTLIVAPRLNFRSMEEPLAPWMVQVFT